MAELREEHKISGVFGGVQFSNNEPNEIGNAGTIRNNNLPIKSGFWSSVKAFWLQDINLNKGIKIELTPYQQKVEDEINEFLHQEITWQKVHDFLFKGITFKKKNI